MKQYLSAFEATADLHGQSDSARWITMDFMKATGELHSTWLKATPPKFVMLGCDR
jgi:hypothetical protein